MSTNRRVYRVAERVKSVVATQALSLGDPRFSLVTITSVQVAPDLRRAKVYWTVNDQGASRDEVKAAFEGAKGSFKKELGRQLGIRFVPDLAFFYDDTLDVLEETERLLDSVKERDSASDNGTGSDSVPHDNSEPDSGEQVE